MKKTKEENQYICFCFFKCDMRRKIYNIIIFKCFHPMSGCLADAVVSHHCIACSNRVHLHIFFTCAVKRVSSESATIIMNFGLLLSLLVSTSARASGCWLDVVQGILLLAQGIWLLARRGFVKRFEKFIEIALRRPSTVVAGFEILCNRRVFSKSEDFPVRSSLG